MARSVAVTLAALAEVAVAAEPGRHALPGDPWYRWRAPPPDGTPFDRPHATETCSNETYNWLCNAAEDRCREVVWGYNGPRMGYIECCSIERFFSPYPYIPSNASYDRHKLINPKVCCPGPTGVGEAYWNSTSWTCEICPTSTPYYDRDEGLCKHLCPEGKEPNAAMNRCLANSSMAVAGGRRLVLPECNAENGDCGSSGPDSEGSEICPDGSAKICTNPPSDDMLCPLGMFCDALPGEGAGCCKAKNPFEYDVEKTEVSSTPSTREDSRSTEMESDISSTPPTREDSMNTETKSNPFDY
eukprot:TRINITY_DN111787_c0_g1_i1.p1 TRINITY_DN111787_c0_g1~~TRINITY_DN111787_c0_g1_i1.p1  ORF type:complete len:300 (+),score=24.08 TRINITY_DN111787_c0_g1_i1:24-923(+)